MPHRARLRLPKAEEAGSSRNGSVETGAAVQPGEAEGAARRSFLCAEAAAAGGSRPGCSHRRPGPAEATEAAAAHGEHIHGVYAAAGGHGAEHVEAAEAHDVGAGARDAARVPEEAAGARNTRSGCTADDEAGAGADTPGHTHTAARAEAGEAGAAQDAAAG